MNPIDYLGALPQSNLAQQFAGFGDSLLNARVMRAKQAEAERTAAAEQELTGALTEYSRNPTAKGAADLMARFPQMAEGIGKSWSLHDSAQKDAEISFGSQVYAALLGGKNEIGVKLLRDRATAKRNSGMDADAAKDEQFASLIEANPQAALTVGGLYLAGGMGDKFQTAFSGFEGTRRDNALQPDAERKAKAEATTAEETAKNAPEAQRLALVKQSEDIRASRENTRLRAIEAAYNREGNDLKRQELKLKLDEAQRLVDTNARAKIAEADMALSSIDQTRGLVSELTAKENRDAVTDAVGFSAGLGGGLFPGTKGKTFSGKIEQLKNALAAENLDKLKGAMSDKDIAFLKQIAGNLDRFQNEGEFFKELSRIDGVLGDNRKRIVTKFGDSVPDEKRDPADSRPPLSSFNR